MTKRQQQKPETIRILVMGPESLWWAVVPRHEAEEALGKKWLLWPNPIYWRLWCALFGAAAFVGISGAGLGNINVLWAFISVPVAALIGWLLGWAYGRIVEKTRNAPIYAVRSEYTGGTRSADPFGYEPLDNVNIKTSTLRQIAGIPEDQSPNGRTTEKSEEMTTISPAAWSSKFLMDRWQMVDDRAAFQGSMSPWDKVKYGSLALIAISLVVMVFLTVMATQDQEPMAALSSNVQEYQSG